MQILGGGLLRFPVEGPEVRDRNEGLSDVEMQRGKGGLKRSAGWNQWRVSSVLLKILSNGQNFIKRETRRH